MFELRIVTLHLRCHLMVVFSLISTDFAKFSLTLHKHLINTVVKGLSTFKLFKKSSKIVFSLVILAKYIMESETKFALTADPIGLALYCQGTTNFGNALFWLYPLKFFQRTAPKRQKVKTCQITCSCTPGKKISEGRNLK